MSTLIIDGRIARKALSQGLIARIKNLPYRPMLAMIQVGDRPDSTAFIRAKKSFAKIVGIDDKHIKVPEDISEKDLVDIVKRCNEDPSIHGIIVQLPLPASIDKDIIIDAIDPRKDADGLSSVNVKKWLEGRGDAILPATARGIRQLLGYYGIGLAGKKVTVIGRSMLVGKPITAMCLAQNATVNVCHSMTTDLANETKHADIVIVATGRPGLVTKKHVRRGQIVIDVGISRTGDGKLVGDVDFAAVSKKVKAISPVPGGVGPMTVFSLFENLVDLCGISS